MALTIQKVEGKQSKHQDLRLTDYHADQNNLMESCASSWSLKTNRQMEDKCARRGVGSETTTGKSKNNPDTPARKRNSHSAKCVYS